MKSNNMIGNNSITFVPNTHMNIHNDEMLDLTFNNMQITTPNSQPVNPKTKWKWKPEWSAGGRSNERLKREKCVPTLAIVYKFSFILNLFHKKKKKKTAKTITNAKNNKKNKKTKVCKIFFKEPTTTKQRKKEKTWNNF